MWCSVQRTWAEVGHRPDGCCAAIETRIEKYPVCKKTASLHLHFKTLTSP